MRGRLTNAPSPPLGDGDEYELLGTRWDELTLAYRVERLEGCGVDRWQAELLSKTSRSVGELEGWLAAGCTPAQALLIAT